MVIYLHLVCIFMCVFKTALCLENEPKCYSRYDYEEKLMEKTVKNDFQMNQILEKFDKTLTELQVIKADFDSANAHLQTLIEDVKENMSNEIQEKLKGYIDAARQPVILFNVRILKDKTPAGGSRLVYTTVEQNIDDAFNLDTGIFKAPVNGTYLFSAQISTRRNKWGAVKIMVKGQPVMTISKYNDAADHTTTSGTTVQRLVKGADVWIQQDADYGAGYYFDGASFGWNQFSESYSENPT